MGVGGAADPAVGDRSVATDDARSFVADGVDVIDPGDLEDRSDGPDPFERDAGADDDLVCAGRVCRRGGPTPNGPAVRARMRTVCPSATLSGARSQSRALWISRSSTDGGGGWRRFGCGERGDELDELLVLGPRRLG